MDEFTKNEWKQGMVEIMSKFPKKTWSKDELYIETKVLLMKKRV